MPDKLYFDQICRSKSKTWCDLVTHVHHSVLHSSKNLCIPMKIPARPFQLVSADIFNASGCDFLVLVDHFSGWPLVAKLHNRTSTTNVLRQLKHWMTDYGAPVKLVSGNGPQFRSPEFQHICKEWYITHVTSSPYNPQSNCIAEAAVMSIKYLLLKTVCIGNID